MTEDERDHLQWVQDCGGSMRAINNPLADWLTSKGYVERQQDLIALTFKGRLLLTPFFDPNPELDHEMFNWAAQQNWATPNLGFQFWYDRHTRAKPTLVQIITTGPLWPILANRMEFVQGLKTYGTEPVFHATPNPRQAMQDQRRPYIRVVHSGRHVWEHEPGDIDLFITENGQRRQIVGKLWKAP